jgi:uncharacterized membrane protein YdjX (TVP38/TMEM64 family)
LNPPDTAAPRRARHRWRWLAVLAFVAVLWGVVEVSGVRAQIGLHAVRQSFEAHHVTGFAIFTALFVLANLAHVPGGFFLAAAVLALGPGWGALTTYVAACISCTVTFVVVRALGADALRELNHPLAQRLFARLDAQPVRSVAWLRLVFQSVPALNYALALSGVKLRHYVLGTLLGLPLPIAVLTMLFDTLGHWFGWVG